MFRAGVIWKYDSSVHIILSADKLGTWVQFKNFWSKNGSFFIIKLPHYCNKYLCHNFNIRISIDLALKWFIEQYFYYHLKLFKLIFLYNDPVVVVLGKENLVKISKIKQKQKFIKSSGTLYVLSYVLLFIVLNEN